MLWIAYALASAEGPATAFVLLLMNHVLLPADGPRDMSSSGNDDAEREAAAAIVATTANGDI